MVREQQVTFSPVCCLHRNITTTHRIHFHAPGLFVQEAKLRTSDIEDQYRSRARPQYFTSFDG